jgi:hypothetical protein
MLNLLASCVQKDFGQQINDLFPRSLHFDKYEIQFQRKNEGNYLIYSIRISALEDRRKKVFDPQLSETGRIGKYLHQNGRATKGCVSPARANQPPTQALERRPAPVDPDSQMAAGRRIPATGFRRMRQTTAGQTWTNRVATISGQC